MKLDSVRNLNATLKHKVFEEVSLSSHDAAKLGLPAGRIADFDQTRPTLALGVAPAGAGDFKVAVRVQHPAMEKSPHLDLISQESNGEFEMRVVGPAAKQASVFQSRQRPLLIGVSIGHFQVKGGTLGCFVKVGDGTFRILSNNHVLANENRGKPGDDIIQPNAFDHGTKGVNTVGALDTFVRLRKKGANAVDCALATVKPGIQFDSATLTGAGLLAGLKTDLSGVAFVEKIGRTTGLTQGRVTAFDLDNVIVTYDTGNLRFDDQLEIEGAGAGSFSQLGDSGSLVFTSGSLLGLGLIIAGTDHGGSNGAGVTYANRLVTVLKALNAQLLP